MTNPEKRRDPWKEALNCYKDVSEEVVVVGQSWEKEFKWSKIGKVFQEGFAKSKSDWVLHLSVDMFIHENDIKKIFDSISKNPEIPALTLPKYKFFEPGRYEIKSFETVLLNKKKFPNIKFDGGGDICLPTINKKVLNQINTKILNVPIWNYDSTFRTKEIIAEDRARFARAWFREFNTYGERGGPSVEEAFDAWFKMVKVRYPFHTNKTTLEKHPKYILDRLNNIKDYEFGSSLFGLKNNTHFSILNKFQQQKIKLRYRI